MNKAFLLPVVIFTTLVFANDNDSLLDIEEQESGGVLERKDAVPSKQISVISKQNIIGIDDLDSAVNSVRLTTCLPFRLNLKDAPANIELVDVKDMGTLAVFPEETRAVINVSALKKDNPAKTNLILRVKKEIARAGLYICGSGFSHNSCITHYLTSLEELDKTALEFPSAEAIVHLRAMNKCGIKLVRFATFRQACREGWAPPPTTEEQKRILEDELKRKPQKPMKIQFDPAAKKGRVIK